jgi:hypothetical protein
MSTLLNIKAAPAAPTNLKMPTFSTASATAMMWEVACKQMSAQEMEWFADGAAEQVNNDVRALSAVLEETACMVASDEASGSFQSAKSTSTLLFHLHNQLSAIAGMAEISEQANWFARQAVKGVSHERHN